MDPRPYHYEYRKPRLSNPTFQSGRLYESIYHIGSFTKVNANVDKITNNFVSPSEAHLSYKLNPQMQRERNYQKETIANNDNKARQRYARNEQQRYARNEQMNNRNINNYETVRYSQHMAAPKPSNNYIPDRQTQRLQQNNNPKPSSQSRAPGQYQSAMDMYERRPSIQVERNLIERKQSIQPRSSSQQTPSLASKQDAYMSNYGSRLMRALPGKDQDFVYERQQKPYNIISCYPKETSNAHRVYPRLTLESKLIETGQYPYLSNRSGQRYLY